MVTGQGPYAVFSWM